MDRQDRIDACIRDVLDAKAVDIRDVPANVSNEEVTRLPLQQQPFLYASGNWGPGYVSIKNLVGRKAIIKPLVHELALLVAERTRALAFVAGNVTGGVVPGWILSEELSELLGREVPFVYIRAARKTGGQKELITGIANNPLILKGNSGLVVEELVNFAETTTNGAESLRDANFNVTHTATILFYNNPEAIKTLHEHRLEMIYLFTLSQVLDVAERYQTHPQAVIDGYREFLRDPLAWQAKRGLTRVERGGTL